MLDLISIGDATLDVFLSIHEATVACQLNRVQCLLCLEYAEKIPVEGIVKVPGAGNASNAAVGASRLGMKTSIVSIVGKDEVGKEIIRRWRKEHIGTEHVQTDAKNETNYSTVLSFQGERTILVYSQPRTYHLPKLEESSWIYYTSLGVGHEKLEEQLLKHLEKHPKLKLVFNPGTKQLRRGLASLKPVIRRCDVFIVNKEEGMRLLEDGDRPMQNLLMSFVHLGATCAVITDGPNGSFATDGENIWRCPIFPGSVKERTGAGDSFTIGFVNGLFLGKDISEAMRYGTANAWSVVQQIGPQAGLLKKGEMQATLKRFRKIVAKKA